jgi:hypothetical protein
VKSLVAILLVVTLFPAFAQLLDVRHDSETTEQYCARIEKLKPNLVLSHRVELSGRIIDGSGAPFKKSVVELRVYALKQSKH